MRDPRILKLAKLIVEHSVKLKKGEYVQIIAEPEAQPLVLELYKLALQKGAFPAIKMNVSGASYLYYKHASNEQLKKFPEVAWYEIRKTDAVIYIGAEHNTKELSSIDPDKMATRMKVMHKISEYRVDKTRWVIFYYPTNALAQEAEMSLHEFEDMTYDSTLLNYELESKKQEKLKRVLDKGRNVRIIGRETDLSFSIDGMRAKKCCGEFNLPDGEVFTTPVKNSVNGKIHYDFPAIHGGKQVEGVTLEFKQGKVVKATAHKNEQYLQRIIKTDKGSCYLGEFGIGTNYKIKKFIKNILFDEKIGGTIHLALGAAYKEIGGKNKSAVHWDMIKDLRCKGKIIIDGKVIQENGKFLI